MDWMRNRSAYAVPRRIPGFPYPERYCPHCEQQLVIETSCHMFDNPEHFKVIYQCHNLNCIFLDNVTHRAYVRVYYSSDLAEENMYKMLLQYKRVEKNNAE